MDTVINKIKLHKELLDIYSDKTDLCISDNSTTNAINDTLLVTHIDTKPNITLSTIKSGFKRRLIRILKKHRKLVSVEAILDNFIGCSIKYEILSNPLLDSTEIFYTIASDQIKEKWVKTKINIKNLDVVIVLVCIYQCCINIIIILNLHHT